MQSVERSFYMNTKLDFSRDYYRVVTRRLMQGSITYNNPKIDLRFVVLLPLHLMIYDP